MSMDDKAMLILMTFFLMVTIIGCVYLLIINIIKKKEKRKYFRVKAELHYCDENCEYDYDPKPGSWGWDSCWCHRLERSVKKVETLIYEDKLIGMKDFELYVQECVDAFRNNCNQIKELRERQGVKYCTNRKELEQKIVELKEKNVKILEEVERFEKKVLELAKATGMPAKMDDIVVDGDKQMTMLNECTNVMERVLAEFEAQKGSKDE